MTKKITSFAERFARMQEQAAQRGRTSPAGTVRGIPPAQGTEMLLKDLDNARRTGAWAGGLTPAHRQECARLILNVPEHGAPAAAVQQWVAAAEQHLETMFHARRTFSNRLDWARGVEWTWPLHLPPTRPSFWPGDLVEQVADARYQDHAIVLSPSGIHIPAHLWLDPLSHTFHAVDSRLRRDLPVFCRIHYADAYGAPTITLSDDGSW